MNPLHSCVFNCDVYTCRSIDISDVDNGSYCLTGLVDNKQYYVMMCAMNINGCGGQSSLIHFVTPQLSLSGK